MRLSSFDQSNDRLVFPTFGGADQVVTDEADGRLPQMSVEGGAGSDTIIGGSQAPRLS